MDDASRIIARLKARFPQIVGPPKDDICYATQNRQEAVRLLSADAQLVLVLGSQNSSNSQRLAELARERGIPAYLIDGANGIDPGWFHGDETVAITAGGFLWERRADPRSPGWKPGDSGPENHPTVHAARLLPGTNPRHFVSFL